MSSISVKTMVILNFSSKKWNFEGVELPIFNFKEHATVPFLQSSKLKIFFNNSINFKILMTKAGF